jgi:hypothetical protein
MFSYAIVIEWSITATVIYMYVILHTTVYIHCTLLLYYFYNYISVHETVHGTRSHTLVGKHKIWRNHFHNSWCSEGMQHMFEVQNNPYRIGTDICTLWWYSSAAGKVAVVYTTAAAIVVMQQQWEDHVVYAASGTMLQHINTGEFYSSVLFFEVTLPIGPCRTSAYIPGLAV